MRRRVLIAVGLTVCAAAGALAAPAVGTLLIRVARRFEALRRSR